MARTANVFARVEPDIKEQAEAILNQLGIPMSNAIGMFLRQVILKQGIPFEMRLPSDKLPVYDDLTREQFDAEMQKGFDELAAGDVIPAEEVHARTRRMYTA